MKKVGRVGRQGSALFRKPHPRSRWAIGLLAAHLLAPGAGFNVDPSTLDARAVSGYAAQAAYGEGHHRGTDAHVIPETFPRRAGFRGYPSRAADRDAVRHRARVDGCASPAGHVNWSRHFRGRSFALWRNGHPVLAPIGAFGAMAFTIGTIRHRLAGADAQAHRPRSTSRAFCSCRRARHRRAGLCGLQSVEFLRYIRDELLIVLGTSSSEAALPQHDGQAGAAGCRPRRCVGLAVPTGYSFNLDGTTIYLTMAAIFIAQATGTDLSLGEADRPAARLMLTSKGSPPASPARASSRSPRRLSVRCRPRAGRRAWR